MKTKAELTARYTGKFGGNTKAATSLVASLKRAATTLNTAKQTFELGCGDREVIERAVQLINQMTRVADSAKSEVKAHALAMKQLEERFQNEAASRIRQVFSEQQFRDVSAAVAFLAWDHRLNPNRYTSWRSGLAAAIEPAKHKGPKNGVMSKLAWEVEYQIGYMINDVVYQAMSEKGATPTKIIDEAKADFDSKLAGLIDREKPLIERVKAGAVQQALESRVDGGA